jgi:uroporphyrinogen decarboxylase
MRTTLQHRQPDHIPYNIIFTQRAYERVVAYTGDPHYRDTLENALTECDTQPSSRWHEVRPDIWEDPFGVQWDRHVDKDIGVVCNCMVTPATLQEYTFPELTDLSFLATVRTEQPGAFITANIGFSLFERAWTLAGMETILMGMADDPDFVHALLDRIVEYNLAVVDQACRYDIDGVFFGDDWGQQTGLIMGPALWREFIKPRLAQMYGRVRAYGKYVVIHSCGKVDSIFPDLIELGLSVFNPFQPEVMDVAAMKREYGQDLTFYGGVSTQRTLPYGTPEEVREEVLRLLDVVGKDGGYICAPAHAIPADAKPENIVAMVETLKAHA